MPIFVLNWRKLCYMLRLVLASIEYILTMEFYILFSWFIRDDRGTGHAHRKKYVWFSHKSLADIISLPMLQLSLTCYNQAYCKFNSSVHMLKWYVCWNQAWFSATRIFIFIFLIILSRENPVLLVQCQNRISFRLPIWLNLIFPNQCW